jgi:hypothetical protein
MTCDRSVVFSGWWPPRYNWNIVESGIKHHKPTSSSDYMQSFNLPINVEKIRLQYSENILNQTLNKLESCISLKRSKR